MTSLTALSQRLTTPVALCILIVSLLLLPALIYSAHWLNASHQSDRLQQKSSVVSEELGERIGVIRTILSSMAGLHKVSPQIEKNKMVQFARELIGTSGFVKHIGKYEEIMPDQRTAFEHQMVNKGFGGFSIQQSVTSGSLTKRESADVYYPLSIIDPYSSETLPMVGLDLGENAHLRKALKDLAKSETSLFSAVADHWKLDGEIIVFKPLSAEQLSAQFTDVDSVNSTGGYWLTLDLLALFNSIGASTAEFDLTVSIVEAQGTSKLFSREAESSTELYFTKFYPPAVFEHQWDANSEVSMVMTLEQPRGFSAHAVAILAACIVVMLLLSSLITFIAISRKREANQKIIDQQLLFNEREKALNTLNSVQDAIITLDDQLCVAHVNPAASVQFNTKPSLAVGKPLDELVQFREAKESYRSFSIQQALSSLSHTSKKEFDVVPVGYSDMDFVFRLSLSSAYDHHSDSTNHVLVLRDISHERRLSRKLAYQANYDALTGCPNRYYFEQKLGNLIDEIPNSGCTHALCYLDLDQFKVVNDTCGHRIGDQLLVQLTNNLKNLIREQDVLSRLGGDEFGLIMTNVTNSEAVALSNRLFEFFQKFIFKHEDNTFSVTASIGVVHIDDSSANIKDVLASADIACYAAKDSGRNSMSVFSKSDAVMSERSVELNWLPRLQNALQNNEFRLHLQPVGSLHSGEKTVVTHFEFLLRLANKDGTESTPWQFIQAAERYDLMRDIDKWVIRNALQTVSNLANGPGGKCSYSINLSGQSAADPALKNYIKSQLEEHRVEPSKIWFELTETAAISHFSVAIDLIKSIRASGALVALDDFGSGLSSFGYLKNLPVDIIKIDGQFVKEIVQNPIDREMVRSIHQVGQSMKIKTVAEFVEDQKTVDELKRIGVNYAQGFHIGRPLPIAEAIDKLPPLSDSEAA